MEATLKQQKTKDLTPIEAEEIFIERMAELLVEQIRNENGEENEEQVKHPIKIME